MSGHTSPVVLITGASSGIGQRCDERSPSEAGASPPPCATRQQGADQARPPMSRTCRSM